MTVLGIGLAIVFLFWIIMSMILLVEAVERSRQPASAWPWIGRKARKALREVQGTFYSHEPVTGYRVSLSVYFDDTEAAVCEVIRYTTPAIRRHMTKREHQAPDLNCTCGFYAYKDQRDAGHSAVKVELYGHVIEHEHGYRASRMRTAPIDPHEHEYGSFWIGNGFGPTLIMCRHCPFRRRNDGDWRPPDDPSLYSRIDP